MEPVAAVEQGRRILICDDERRLADLTAGLLRHFGFVAEAVGDGEAALALAGADPGFDVLILDLTLHGGMSSSEVVRKLAALARGTRVILTSGYSPEDVPQELMRDPSVVCYLPKPYPVESLVAAVRVALSER